MIKLMTAWSPEYAPLGDITWRRNKELYAKKWGYESLAVMHPTGVDIMWHRPQIWLDALNDMPDGSWLLFTGSDAVITRPELALAQFLDDEFDFICLVDRITIFSDVWLMRSCSATKSMLKSILAGSVRSDRRGTEQDALTEYLCGMRFEEYRARAGTDYGTEEFYNRSQEKLNKKPVRVKLLRPWNKFTGDPTAHWPDRDDIIPWYHAWTLDHFILHMGGKTLEYRLKWLPTYLRDI